MNGLMKKSKSQIVSDYIKRVNPYENPQPIAFDLRGYADYMKKNGLKGSDITPEIMNKFSKNKV